MLGKNLKYYRLKMNLSKRELASLIHVTPMSIGNYESGKRKPSMEVLQSLAQVLNVRVSDFLAHHDENLTFVHGEFRKGGCLTVRQQEYICASVEEYMGRFYSILEILGGNVLPDPPAHHRVSLSSDAEEDAKNLRRCLNISNSGPIGNLVELLENKGILIVFLPVENDAFSGMNGLVSERPYIAVNAKMSPERIRSTIAHEMAHIIFIWPGSMTDKETEERATAISGAFLLSDEDIKREIGYKRSAVTNDMTIVCKEYGVSMYLLVKRANLCGIITNSAAKNFYIQAGQYGWKRNEPTRIPKEEPMLFSQLVFRAVSEHEISVQKGAELLNQSYEYVAKQCFATEG